MCLASVALSSLVSFNRSLKKPLSSVAQIWIIICAAGQGGAEAAVALANIGAKQDGHWKLMTLLQKILSKPSDCFCNSSRKTRKLMSMFL